MLPRITLTILIICALAVLLLNTSATARDTALLTLSASNTVSLALPVTSDSVRYISEELLAKSDKLSANSPIYLVLNSPGGSITDGRHLANVVNGLPQKVHTVSMFSASMSFMLSQFFGVRYVLEDSVLMSHRAAVEGMDGQIPGTLNSRTNALTEEILSMEKQVAERAGMPLEAYQKAIADEMWLNAQTAVSRKFADKIVRIRCDDTLRGYGPTQTFNIFIFTVNIQFHKCPLITEPRIVSGNQQAMVYFRASQVERLRLLNQ